MVQSKQRKVWAKKLASREQDKRLDQQVADIRAATKQAKEVSFKACCNGLDSLISAFSHTLDEQRCSLKPHSVCSWIRTSRLGERWSTSAKKPIRRKAK